MPSKENKRNKALPSTISSNKLIKILIKIGARPERDATGSHQMWTREVNGVKKSTVVVLGKKEIPLGTFRSILRQLGISEQEFCAYLGTVFIFMNSIKSAVLSLFGSLTFAFAF